MRNKIETKQYPDGTFATGVAPLPEASPREVNDFPPPNIQHDLTQAQMALVNKLWLELRDNPELRYARQRLSLHELREIVLSLVLAVPEKREFVPEVDESIRAQNELHEQIYQTYQRDQTKAERDVIAERRRQIEVEGWTPEHDDEHDSGELADVAACYALSVYSDRSDAGPSGDIPPYWPKSLDESWWNPKDKRRNLVRAAALLIAEIERLDRAAMAKGE